MIGAFFGEWVSLHGLSMLGGREYGHLGPTPGMIAMAAVAVSATQGWDAQETLGIWSRHYPDMLGVPGMRAVVDARGGHVEDRGDMVPWVLPYAWLARGPNLAVTEASRIAERAYEDDPDRMAAVVGAVRLVRAALCGVRGNVLLEAPLLEPAIGPCTEALSAGARAACSHDFMEAMSAVDRIVVQRCFAGAVAGALSSVLAPLPGWVHLAMVDALEGDLLNAVGLFDEAVPLVKAGNLPVSWIDHGTPVGPSVHEGRQSTRLVPFARLRQALGRRLLG